MSTKTTAPDTRKKTSVHLIQLGRSACERSVGDQLRDFHRVTNEDPRLRVEIGDVMYPGAFTKRLSLKSIDFQAHVAHAQAALALALCEKTNHKDWVIRVSIDAWQPGEPGPEEIEAVYVATDRVS